MMMMKPDDETFFTKVVDDISDNSTRELYVRVPNVLPTLPTLSPMFDTLIPFSSENEDKVHLLSHPVSRLVPSCYVIFDLEPLPLSFDFVFYSEIIKSFSFLLTISLDRLDILKEDLEYQSLQKSLSLIIELS
ncbi:hypothetical protein Tco_0966287 [Tanacetum coccineum]